MTLQEACREYTGKEPARVVITTMDGARVQVDFSWDARGGRSSTERAILAALDDREWHTGQQLAKATGYSRSSWFNAILCNMGEAGFVEVSNKGYRLPV